MMDNNKKTVFISGATSGIGKSCAFIFAKNNYQLILTGRRKERLEQIKNDLENEFHVKIQTLCFDVTDLKQTQNAIRQIIWVKTKSIKH